MKCQVFLLLLLLLQFSFRCNGTETPVCTKPANPIFMRSKVLISRLEDSYRILSEWAMRNLFLIPIQGGDKMNEKNVRKSARNTLIRCTLFLSAVELKVKETSAGKSHYSWATFLFCSLQTAEIFLLLILGSTFIIISRHFGGLLELVIGILCIGLVAILAISTYLFMRKDTISRYVNLIGLLGVLVLAVIAQFSTGTHILLGAAILTALSVGTLLIQAYAR
jgi:hypothetical protein